MFENFKRLFEDVLNITVLLNVMNGSKNRKLVLARYLASEKKWCPHRKSGGKKTKDIEIAGESSSQRKFLVLEIMDLWIYSFTDSQVIQVPS